MSQSNNILADFNMLLNTDIGVFKVLKGKYNNPKYFDSEFINNIDTDALIYNLMNTKYGNILDLFIKEEYKDQSNSLYNQIMDNDIDLVYDNSIITECLNLFKVYMESGIISISILCKNEKEEQIINKLDSRLNVIKYNEDKIDCKDYDTIFLKDYKDVVKFKDLHSKNIFISNHMNNLDDEKGTPLLDISLIVARTNKICTIDLHQKEKILG